LQRARERGRRRIVLDVAPDDTVAQDLYRSHGFEELALSSPFVAFEVPDGFTVLSRTVGGAAAKRAATRRPAARSRR
jgi:hypothetical protein